MDSNTISTIKQYVLYLFIVAMCHQKLIYAEECTISVKSGIHRKNSPIIITYNSSNNQPAYLYPTAQDPANLHFDKGSKVKVFCPGRTNVGSTSVTKPGHLQIENKILKSDQHTARCVGGDRFEMSDRVVNFVDVSCEARPKTKYNAIIRRTGERCVNGERFEVGYEMGNGDFLTTFDMCHDETLATTLWTHNVIVPTNQKEFRYTGGTGKNFKTGGLFKNVSITYAEPYNLNVQYNTLKSILKKNVDKFVSRKIADRKYLARGHLTANADELYKSEQEATFFYANTVPMWQRINSQPGNWYFVEEYVRRLAFRKFRELEVYTGGVRVLHLKKKPIYLVYNVKGNKVLSKMMPVPRVLFKCAVDVEKKESMCFLVVNNPYLTRVQLEANKKNYVLCNRLKVCDSIRGNELHLELGYMYCCSLRDFWMKNRDRIGLEDVQKFLKFKDMRLLTMDE